MVKVAMHIRKDEQTSHWSGKEIVELSRVPTVGEHISTGLDKSPGYKVTLVNHHAFNHPDDVEAEVWVVPV